LAGPLYINHSCDSCHSRNGRASVAAVGEALEQWVFRVGNEDGQSHPKLGEVLQFSRTSGEGEGSVSIAEWEELDGGLRRPVYSFDGERPERFSGRLTPALVGMGLIEALAEADVLEWEDPNDSDGDGISGRAQRIPDPETGELRLGRFGWKAGATSLRHQVASALNTDMGVMTSVFSDPDCGSAQSDCGNTEGAELSEAHLDNLVRYVALLGVRGRRDFDDPSARRGEGLFHDTGCEDCHRSSYITSSYHPLAELRNQSVFPYSDFLLHDMGEELADSLGEADASGAEWRTPPLWGLGLGPCVTGGVEGAFQSQTCVEDASYLHDGRARSIDEAILWHGGEGAASRAAYQALSAEQKSDLVRFLRSL
ncbi:MAG: di-heme oxidoredictase family protein, partial [Myxococcota bacterium]|nr:di-heme oxidoredictase family protein [Myxococcota bacterium]